MLALLETHRADIAALCRRYHVRQLEVFGSAARGTDFKPARSDIDLLVTYQPDHAPDFAEFLALQDALIALLGHQVDLIMEGTVRNPFVRAGIERSRQPLYAA